MTPNNGMKMDGLYFAVWWFPVVTIEVAFTISWVVLARHLCLG
jgi:hypothetical protein